MLLNTPLITDWKAIARTRKQKVNENLCYENAKRILYEYGLDQHVLKLVFKLTKLGRRTFGSFAIECVHVNGKKYHETTTESTQLLKKHSVSLLPT